MSGNIHDTDLEKLYSEIQLMKKDMRETPCDLLDREFFEKKYNYLNETSKTLFKFIFENYKKEKFDADFFEKCINNMFNNIKKIQDGKISQFSASANVGKFVGKKFIKEL